MALLHQPVMSPKVLPDGNPYLLKAELCVFITSCLDLWMSFDFCGPCGHLSNKWQFSEHSSVNILSFQVTLLHDLNWLSEKLHKAEISYHKHVLAPVSSHSDPSPNLFLSVKGSGFSQYSVFFLLFNAVIALYLWVVE